MYPVLVHPPVLDLGSRPSMFALNYVQTSRCTVKPMNNSMDLKAQKMIEVAAGYFELGMLEEAVAELEGLGRRERLSVLIVWSAELRIANRWVEMLGITQILVKLYPEEPETWVSLADATRHAKSINEGLTILRKAEQDFPEDSHVKFQLGCYYCQLGDLGKARDSVRTAVKIHEVWAKIATHDEDLKLLWPEFRSRLNALNSDQ